MKISWGVWISIAYIIFAGSMIGFAILAGNQKYDLVTENYYDKAVAYQEKIDAVVNGGQSGSNLRMSYDTKSHSIRIEKSITKNNIRGDLYFYKPDNAKYDFHISFNISSGQNILLINQNLNHGLWNTMIQWKENNLSCISEQKIFVQ